MAFFGQDERDEMNAEQAQIEITGGEGEPEGEAEEHVNNDGKNDSSLKPPEHVNNDGDCKNEMHLFVHKQKNMYKTVKLKDLHNWDDPRNQLFHHFLDETDAAIDFWQEAFYCIRYGIYDEVDYTAVSKFTEHAGYKNAFDGIYKGKQLVGISRENEGLFGDALKYLYKEDDDPKTRWESVKLNLSSLRDDLILELNNRDRTIQDCATLTKAVALEFKKQNPGIDIFDANKEAMAKFRQDNPLDPDLVEIERLEDEKEQLKEVDPRTQLEKVQLRQRELKQFEQALKLKQKELREQEKQLKQILQIEDKKELHHQQKHKKKQHKRQKRQKQGKEPKPGKGNFSKKPGKK